MFTAKSVRDCWKDDKYHYNETEPFYGPGDYTPLVKAMCDQIVLEVGDNDYQGDTRYILRRGDEWGLLIIGWGSCSGCDALQATSTWDEIAELANSIANDIKWYPSKADLAKYVKERDWLGTYCWHEEETKRFVAEANVLLAA